MLIIGTHFFTWGSGLTENSMHCGKCGMMGQFKMKKGMRFITIFFLIPVIPISGVRELMQCPSCGTRYQSAV